MTDIIKELQASIVATRKKAAPNGGLVASQVVIFQWPKIYFKQDEFVLEYWITLEVGVASVATQLNDNTHIKEERKHV